MLEHYISVGFSPQAQIVLTGTRFNVVERNWLSRPGWLYAFVSDGEVRYVGRTINPLGARLDSYRHGGDQCARIRACILADLSAGREMWLYGRQIDDTDAIEQEEGRLRREFRPPWNRA